MKAVVDKKELEKVLKRCAAVADKSAKPLMPALACVRLVASGSSLTVDSTNLQIHIRGTVVITKATDGMVLVNARDLGSAVGNMPDGGLVLEDGERGLVVTHVEQRRKYTLPVYEDEFPSDSVLNAETPIGFAAADLERLIIATQYAIATDDTRASLGCAFLELEGKVARMVATDGHRMGHVEVEVADKQKKPMSFLLPRKCVAEMLRICAEDPSGMISMGLTPKGERLVLRSGTYRVSAALGAGPFPPYQQVIPDEDRRNRVSVDASSLIKAVRACSMAHRIVLQFSGEGIALNGSAEKGGEAFDLVPAIGYAGSPISVGVAGSYLVDALSALDGMVDVTFGYALDPVVVRGASNPNTFGIVMPMSIEGAKS